MNDARKDPAPLVAYTQALNAALGPGGFEVDKGGYVCSTCGAVYQGGDGHCVMHGLRAVLQAFIVAYFNETRHGTDYLIARKLATEFAERFLGDLGVNVSTTGPTTPESGQAGE